MESNRNSYAKLQEMLGKVKQQCAKAKKDLIQEKEEHIQLKIYLEVLEELSKINELKNGIYSPVDYPFNMEQNQNNLIQAVYDIVNN